MSENDIFVRHEVDAKKQVHGEQHAIDLIHGSKRVVACRGKKVVEFDLKKSAPDVSEVLKVTLGPTGNLRAPTLRVGDMLVVGFNDQAYLAALG